MAEYIEREALKRIYMEKGIEKGKIKLSAIINELELLPAADVTPVVHGRWNDKYKSGYKPEKGVVSSCCDMWNDRKTSYCPNCGAKMDGGESGHGG